MPPTKFDPKAATTATTTTTSGFSFGQSARFAESSSLQRKKTIDASSKPRSINQDTQSLRSQSTVYSEKKIGAEDYKLSDGFQTGQRKNDPQLDESPSKEDTIGIDTSPVIPINKEKEARSETANSQFVSEVGSPRGRASNLHADAMSTELPETALFLSKSMPPSTIAEVLTSESNQIKTTSEQKPRDYIGKKNVIFFFS